MQWASEKCLSEECISNLQTQINLTDKLDFSGSEYTKEQSIFKNLALFNFQSNCVQEESFKNTDTKKNRLENIFPSQFPFPQFLWKNQFSLTILILIILLLRFSVHLKI